MECFCFFPIQFEGYPWQASPNKRRLERYPEAIPTSTRPAGLVYHLPGVSTPGCQDDRANTHPCLAHELNAFELFGSIEDIFRFLSEILRTFQRFLLVRNIANVLSERYEADISWQAPCSKRLFERSHLSQPQPAPRVWCTTSRGFQPPVVRMIVPILILAGRPN